MDLLREFELEQTKKLDRPRLKPGDIVRVTSTVKEGGKTRPQTFEGTVLGIRGSGPSTSFTVRRDSGKWGVERVFPLYSPLITDINIVKRQKVRRAKLNYLREAGRRRVKEDIRAMQHHEKEEKDKIRFAEEVKKKAEEEKVKAEAEQKKAEVTEAKAKEENPEKKPAEKPEAETTDEKKE